MLSSLCVTITGINILINPLRAQHVRIYHEIMDDPTGWTLGASSYIPYTSVFCINTLKCCQFSSPSAFVHKIFPTEGYRNIYVKVSAQAIGTTYALDALYIYLYPDASLGESGGYMHTYWYPDTFNNYQGDLPLNITFYPIPANYIDNKPNMKLEWRLVSPVPSMSLVYLSHLEIYGIPIANPTTYPTSDPTRDPTNDPTNDPTTDPTYNPTQIPTVNPTTVNPTYVPTLNPTKSPTFDPTIYPIQNPSTVPTESASGTVRQTNITTFQSQKESNNGNKKEKFIQIIVIGAISILFVIGCINVFCVILYLKKNRKRMQISRSIITVAICSETEDMNIIITKGENNDLQKHGIVENECGIELGALSGENEEEISDDSDEDLYSQNCKPTKDEIETAGNCESESDDTHGSTHVTVNNTTGDC